MLSQSVILLSLLGSVLCKQLWRHDPAFTPQYVLRITYELTSQACRYKPIALVNGTAPGPTLYMTENETTWVRVYNDMPSQNLTMHWHGLSQSVAPFSDGTPQASQWPVAPMHFFDYEIRPDIGEAGTYFYHSHVDFQAASVAGGLIVKEASGRTPYKYDDEKILLLSETFNKTDGDVIAALRNQPQLIWPGEAETILVNGKGYTGLDGNASLAPQPWSQYISNTTSSCGPEVIEVQPGRTYRFRAIGGMALSYAVYGFEDHDNISIIAADGQYTRPAPVDRVQIGAGQRYDFLLHTKTVQELRALNKTDFWIQVESRFRPINITSYAILRYVSTELHLMNQSTEAPASPPAVSPLSFPRSPWDWLESTLQPLQNNGFPSREEVTRTVYLTSVRLQTDRSYWSVNNHTWTEHNSIAAGGSDQPYLVNIFEQGEAAIPNYNLSVSQYGGWDPELNVYAARVGEVIDIVLINEATDELGGYDAHPWHIHGGHIWDLGSGPGGYNATLNEGKFETYTPVKRDTTMLFEYALGDPDVVQEHVPQGWRAWRLKVDVPGVWMIHCHILQHMIMGMQTVWVMGNATEITAHLQPYVSGYLTYGGDAYGNASYDPLVNHYFN
ncbi:hypothetical protein AMS68_004093 [Peltaster fructicola]|uniref:L-ascorbate oxidase n=1 Tax=Peltaster fructicola TaxID=286661 RepID=A0A6H0XV63_9PEZI|nr:hypothetical protein AMS68_004093 [Peltaster fructicola]